MNYGIADKIGEANDIVAALPYKSIAQAALVQRGGALKGPTDRTIDR